MSAAPELEPAPKKSKTTLVVVLIVVAVGFVFLLICAAIVAAIAIPNLLASKTAAMQVSAIAALKQTATAQAQFRAQNDYYADSAAKLTEAGCLTDPRLVQAFQQHNNNADTGTQPRTGYLFRMLHGEGANPTGWVANPAGGGSAQPGVPMLLSSWGATARPAEPGTTGNMQYFIGEAGLIYQNSQPTNPDFVLSAAPLIPQDAAWTLAR